MTKADALEALPRTHFASEANASIKELKNLIRERSKSVLFCTFLAPVEQQGLSRRDYEYTLLLVDYLPYTEYQSV